MTEAKQKFIRDLAKENNSLVQSLLKSYASTGSKSNLDQKTSFDKLIRIIQGLPCNRQWLSTEITLLYNHLLMLRSATHLNASIPLGPIGRNTTGNHTLRFGAHPVKTSDDAIQTFLSRVEDLNGIKIFAGGEKIVLSGQLIKLLLLVSFPGSAKAMLLRLSVAYCLRLLDCQLLKEASEMSLQLFDQMLPRLTDLLQIDSIDVHLNLPRSCSEQMSSGDASSVLADGVRVVAAISAFRLLDWNRCLECVRQTTTFPLKLCCLYVEGYILYEQKTSAEAAVSTLSELLRRADLSRELSLNARNLIGCCLSSQGKHRSAIQVFKKCLQDDFLFFLPLYNISIQYQKLFLFDAEIETLQLLGKLLENNECQKCANDANCLRFDARESSGHQMISRQQVLQLLARRCLELERYADAVSACEELLSHLSTIGRCLDQSDPADIDNHRLLLIDLLYSQTIYANIRARNFDEASTLCDNVLSKTNPTLDGLSRSNSRPFRYSYRSECSTSSESKALSMPKANLQTKTPRVSGKRLHEEENCASEHRGSDGAKLSHDVTNRLFDATVLLYKAEALANVCRRSDALPCVNQAISILELSWMDTGERNNSEQPCAKKTKVDNTAKESEQPFVWGQMLSDAYSMKGLILITLDRTQDALHWSRLAYQLNNSDTEKVYNLTLLLYKLQRNNEAASLWLSHRCLVAVSHDTLQIDMLLKRCSADLEKLTTKEIRSREGRYCLLDVEMLKILRTLKRRT